MKTSKPELLTICEGYLSVNGGFPNGPVTHEAFACHDVILKILILQRHILWSNDGNITDAFMPHSV